MGGRTIAEAFTSTAVDLSNERQQTDFNTHLSQNTMVGLMVLLCALISIMGLVLVIPWHRIWRSREEYMADRLANTGLKKKAIEAISSQVYRKLGSEESPAECPICLAEFVEGERVRVLPKCKHSFHLECVDKWLLSHSSCPTCRNCLLKKEAHDYIQSGTDRSEACVDMPRPAADGGHRISSDIECDVSPLMLSVSLC